MIKNIIFDLGNVIINYDQQAIINRFAKTNEEKEYLMEDNFKAPEWKKIDLGEINNDEAIESINKRHNNKFAELTDDFWHNWFKMQKINEDVVELAKQLKDKGYNIYVLSNMANATYNFFKGHAFFKLCNGIIISAQEHIKKPDERIFNILLDRYNLKVEECLFIDDDDTNRSYETANKLGILGRRVIPNDCNDIKKELEEFNIQV
jgi:putative hydrolase of the HAD superfamily